MKPRPILATPTPDSRERFLRFIYTNGYDWCVSRLTESLLNDARKASNYTYAYLANTTFSSSQKSILFTEYEEQYQNMMSGGEYVVVNSPAHFITYANTFK